MLPLFFVEDLVAPKLVGDNAHHAERVLRLKSGEEILVSDGAGNWSRCEVLRTSKSEVALKVIESGSEALSTVEISVLQALPKSDRAWKQWSC